MDRQVVDIVFTIYKVYYCSRRIGKHVGEGDYTLMKTIKNVKVLTCGDNKWNSGKDNRAM